MNSFFIREGKYIIKEERRNNVSSSFVPVNKPIIKFQLTNLNIRELWENKILNLHGIEFHLKDDKLEIITALIAGEVINSYSFNKRYDIKEYVPKLNRIFYILVDC